MSVSTTFPFGQQIVWQPDETLIRTTNMFHFMQKHGIANYSDLFQKSVKDIRWFWNAALDDLGIEFYSPYSSVVEYGSDPRFPRWCVDGKLNIIHNCLDKWQNSEHRHQPALKWENETGTEKTLSYAELNAEVCRCANALRNAGFGKGDAIGLYMPMIPELAIAFLAIIKIGGIILPLFSGYGASAIASRLADAGAKAVFCADGSLRRGKKIPMKNHLDDALQSVPDVSKVIVVPYVQIDSPNMLPGRDLYWNDFMAENSDSAKTEQTSAEDILMIIYTSGTTGKPKGAVHTHCGFPVKSAQDLFHPMDLKPGDTLYWMTDMGWMMGPWQVFGSLLIGASMLFYDGAPDYPDVDRVWKLVAKHAVTHLGVSPTLIRTLQSHGNGPVKKHDVSSLRMAGSTGSPWDPESWMWLFENVLESKKPIINYSGGTEISGGILCGNFLQPLKPCAFSGPVIGMDVDVLNDSGEPVRNEVGELVIRQPWIGMTRGFWNDRQRYIEAYWQRFENIWVHGDFAAIDEDGLWYILGRSDDTIKVAGKRLGPAEVESILNAHPQITESAAIGVPHKIKGQEVVAFCVPVSAAETSEDLRRELMNSLISELGKPLKPKEILFVNALPKTRNAKVMHRVIRATYLGESPGDLSSIENPDTVDAIRSAS